MSEPHIQAAKREVQAAINYLQRVQAMMDGYEPPARVLGLMGSVKGEMTKASDHYRKASREKSLV